MFGSDVSRDEASRKVTRRVFLSGCVAVAAGSAMVVAHSAPGEEASTEVHGTPGVVTVVLFSDDGRKLGTQTVAKVVKTDGAWYRQLGKISFDIVRRADTEMPSEANAERNHGAGVFRCLGCDTALFSSQTKFNSGTGWPSFFAPIAKENLKEVEDRSLSETRTEVRCVRCEGHLGHVFDDGPEPTGLRYCMNAGAMRFAAAV